MDKEETCKLCLKRPAKHLDRQQDITVLVCGRCLQQNEIERLLNKKLLEIVKLLKKKNYKKAKQKIGSTIREISKGRPTYIKQWLERQHMDWLSTLYFLNSNYDKTIQIINKRRRRAWDSSYSKLSTHLKLAEAYFKMAQYDKVLKTLEECLQIGIKEKEPSALSALEKLRDVFGEDLKSKPLYAESITALSRLKGIKTPKEIRNIKNTKDLTMAINWISSVKSQWF